MRADASNICHCCLQVSGGGAHEAVHLGESGSTTACSLPLPCLATLPAPALLLLPSPCCSPHPAALLRRPPTHPPPCVQIRHSEAGLVSVSLQGDEFCVTTGRALMLDETHQVSWVVPSGGVQFVLCSGCAAVGSQRCASCRGVPVVACQRCSPWWVCGQR